MVVEAFPPRPRQLSVPLDGLQILDDRSRRGLPGPRAAVPPWYGGAVYPPAANDAWGFGPAGVSTSATPAAGPSPTDGVRDLRFRQHRQIAITPRPRIRQHASGGPSHPRYWAHHRPVRWGIRHLGAPAPSPFLLARFGISAVVFRGIGCPTEVLPRGRGLTLGRRSGHLPRRHVLARMRTGSTDSTHWATGRWLLPGSSPNQRGADPVRPSAVARRPDRCQPTLALGLMDESAGW